MRSNLNLWLLSFVVCIGLLSCNHSEEERGKSNSKSKVSKTDTNSVQITEIIDPVEIQPSYPGGQKRLQEFIRNNLHYPKNAKPVNTTGKVFVQFMVLANGKIDSIWVVKGLGVEFDREAIRIIKLMPNWIPSQQDGKPVACKYTLPVFFESGIKAEKIRISPNEKTIKNEKDTIIELPIQNDEDMIIDSMYCIEPMPQFPGGMKALTEFFQENLHYPEKAVKNKIQGKVFVSFLILKNGKIDSVSVIKGIGFGCDEESVRVVKLMPDWIYDKKNGKSVKIRYTLPINFSL